MAKPKNPPPLWRLKASYGEDDCFELTFVFSAQDIVTWMRSVAPDDDIPDRPGVFEVYTALKENGLIELARRKADGAPKKYGDEKELLEAYAEWQAANPANPAHGDREFARKHMGAETDREIRAATQKLRDAKKAAAEKSP